MTTWGRILVGTRLEKTVSATFVQVWTMLLQGGLRPGDATYLVSGKPAHAAANELARVLLQSDCDTLFMLDSDAAITADFLHRFRDLKAGQEFDILQAGYCRRGWPPEAIWFKAGDPANPEAYMAHGFVTDKVTEPVAAIGTHAVLIRRSVFEGLLGGRDRDTCHWFYYPYDSHTTEDVAFSLTANHAGYKLGATSEVWAGHLSEINVNWGTYQDYMTASGQRALIDRYNRLSGAIADMVGVNPVEVRRRAMRGGLNVKEAWERLNPVTPDEVRAFYGNPDNGYLYDLLAWNTTQVYAGLLRELHNLRADTAMVIGPGLGTEIDALLQDGTRYVEAIELPGVLFDFCSRLYADDERVRILQRMPVAQYDVVVSFDTLEHVHPDELPAMLTRIGHRIKPGGLLIVHVNGGDTELYPMHYPQNAQTVQDWINACGFVQVGPYTWREPTTAP